MKPSIYKISLLLTVLLLGSLMVSVGAFTPWDGHTLCSNSITSGACLGNITYSGTVSLTGDLNISGNLTVLGILNTQGYSIAVGQIFTSNSAINTNYGSATNGNGQSFSNSFGGSGGAADAYTSQPAGDAGPANCGGITLYAIGCSTGGTPSAPSMSNPLIQNWILNGIQNFLEGAGGGGVSNGFFGTNGGAPTYGIYLQARIIMLGSGASVNSAGQNGGSGERCETYCNSVAGGGSGGGTIVLTAKTIHDSGVSYNINGGGTEDCSQPGHSCASYGGGNGQVVKFTYSTQPVPTPFLPPRVANVLPNNVLELSATVFTVNLIEVTNPIKNYTIYWGDGTFNSVTTNTLSNTISHTYPYIAPTTAFTANVFVCDILGNCNDSFQQTIRAFYNPPYGNTITANAIPSNTVLESKSYLFTINDIQGNYTIKNTTINWGDGTYNIIISNSVTVNALHTYSYTATTKPDTLSPNIVVCDVNNVCTTVARTIYGTYTVPKINKVTYSNVYSTLANSYVFNIIQGNYSLSALQVNWGDGTTPTFIAINTLTPTVSHTYAIAGNYPMQAIAIDINGAQSVIFTNNVPVQQYVSPKISSLSPTSVYSANSIAYKYNIIKGTFNIINPNSVVINWGNGNTVYLSNVVNGINMVSFDYPNNGNFSAFETVTDINGYTGVNTTLIDVGAFPWNFTTPTPIIYYNVTNRTTQKLVQTNETDNLPVNYTLQKQNIVNDYVCSPSISNTGLFSISCITNPNVFSYTNQTLSVAIYATDTHGATKQITETIHLFPKSPPPVPPATPFNTNTVAQPLKSKPFIPLSVSLLTVIFAVILVTTVTVAYISRKGKRNEDN